MDAVFVVVTNDNDTIVKKMLLGHFIQAVSEELPFNMYGSLNIAALDDVLVCRWRFKAPDSVNGVKLDAVCLAGR